MTRIVTTHYRYKRPPVKRKAVAGGRACDQKREEVSKPGDTSRAGER